MNLKREIESRLEQLNNYALDPKGGLTRLLYTKEWKETQDHLRNEALSKGYDVQYDSIGNLYITLPGSSEEVILVGSHIDTVCQGGKLDGQFGIVSGLIALDYLKSKEGQPKKTIRVVSLAEEEGSRFPYTFWGSKNTTNSANIEEVEHLVDNQGVNFMDAMRNCGFSYSKEKNHLFNNVSSFLEVHIEQGQILEKEKIQIGLVTDIVGQKRYSVTVQGQANHAGTTPMHYRQDALLASSIMVQKVNELARSISSTMVATVGKMEIFPNSSNVVAQEVQFTIDLRHTNVSELERYEREIKEEFDAISTQQDVKYSMKKYMDGKPVKLDESLLKTIKDVCRKHHISYKEMISGAGHDAQIFAPLVQTALVFVPSIGGISHNPSENTAIEDLETGVKVLIESLKKLAY